MTTQLQPALTIDTSIPPAITPIRQQLQIKGALIMYVGNLESYQGIDLLLESFIHVLPQAPDAHIVAIGGTPEDIDKYQTLASNYSISANVHFIGPRPIAHLKQYLEKADILVSPRTQGNNTPMKLYSYLDSGKALLATNLTTHTQVLAADQAPEMAYLANPDAHDFGAGLLHLINHPNVRETLGRAAQSYIAREHTYTAFSHKLNTLYDWLTQELT